MARRTNRKPRVIGTGTSAPVVGMLRASIVLLRKQGRRPVHIKARHRASARA